NPLNPDGEPEAAPRIDRKQGQRMSELRKNVVKFSGTPEEDVEEWLDKLDMVAGPDGFNLNYHDQALLLRLSVSGDAYQAVLMVRPGDPKTDPLQKGYLARVRSELRKRFGKSPDQAVNQLCDISFTNYNTVDEYATAINRLGELKKIFFYRGLPHNFPASASIKPFCLDPTSTFEQVLEKARLYFDSNSEARVAAPGVRRNIGKGGKGRGKGKGRRGSSDTIITQAAIEKVYGDKLPVARQSVAISTIKGPQYCDVHNIPSYVLSCNLLNDKHMEVLVVKADHLVKVGDHSVDVILGCDWIRKHAPIVMKKVGTNELTIDLAQEQPRVAAAAASINRQETLTNDGFKQTAVIEDTDFRAVRLTGPDGNSKWRVQWKWTSKTPPPRVFRPAIYEKQMQTLTPSQRNLWQKELDNWEKQGFIEEVPRYELDGTLTLMAAVQEHKVTTPCRPVIDFKPLNNQIFSLPNSDDHVTCQDTIRRWRAGRAKDGHVIGKWVLIDIRKAYLCIEMQRDCANYQGLIIKARALERLGVMANPTAKSTDSLDLTLIAKARKLYNDIQATGDPAKGVFTVDPDAPWKL
ncbi:hypothetical protein FOZ63_001049, partial [Perkinsus olseni]